MAGALLSELWSVGGSSQLYIFCPSSSTVCLPCSYFRVTRLLPQRGWHLLLALKDSFCDVTVSPARRFWGVASQRCHLRTCGEGAALTATVDKSLTLHVAVPAAEWYVTDISCHQVSFSFSRITLLHQNVSGASTGLPVGQSNSVFHESSDAPDVPRCPRVREGLHAPAAAVMESRAENANARPTPHATSARNAASTPAPSAPRMTWLFQETCPPGSLP